MDYGRLHLRIIELLEEKNIIRRKGKKIGIMDREKLREMAEEQGSEGKVDGAFGPEGCVEGLRRFAQGGNSACGAEGCGIALSGDEYKAGVTD